MAANKEILSNEKARDLLNLLDKVKYLVDSNDLYDMNGERLTAKARFYRIRELLMLNEG